MEDEFRMYVKACTKCNAMKQPRAYLKAPMKRVFFHHFNDCIVVDHIVPAAERRPPRGFRYILTITDAWSNFVVAVPVRTQTAKENIAAIMNNWVYKHGVCREIIVDNHPGFTSNFFAEVWSHFECKKTHGTSYKSASTSRAENSNKRINQALRACLPLSKEHHWDEYLGKVTFALNCLKNRRTGYSANRMVYGRELNIPLTLLVQDGDSYRPTNVYQSGFEVYELHKKMKGIIRKVRENADIDFMYAKRYHDRNLHGPYFKAGDYCYVLIQCPSHKYSIRFRGPLRVNRVINDHLYLVQITPEKEKVINVCKMKHYELNRYSRRKIDEMNTPIKPKDKPKHTPEAQRSRISSDEDSDDDMITFHPVDRGMQKPLGQTATHVQDTSEQSKTRITPARVENPEVLRENEMVREPNHDEHDPTDNLMGNDTDDEMEHVLEEENQQLHLQGEANRSARPGLRDRSLIKRPVRLGNVSKITPNEDTKDTFKEWCRWIFETEW